MALHDLTPQLRTRLSRMERAVGWFVVLATLLMVFGFGYYVYKTAERRGWFLTKAKFFTFVRNADGLAIGDPVKLMGFDAGHITDIQPMPPMEFQYNVYVEFELLSPNYGYMWTEGSRARVAASGLLNKRTLEVTKGTGGHAIYISFPLRQIPFSDVDSLPPGDWRLAEDVYRPASTQLVARAFSPLKNVDLNAIASVGQTDLFVLDFSEKKKALTGVWNERANHYDLYYPTNKPYWLRSDESPAITERLEAIASQVQNALPNFLNLTNELAAVLSNSANMTSNLNYVGAAARLAVSNLNDVLARLQHPGALGEWLLPTNLNRHLDQTVATANTNLLNLDQSLINLANLTSNLNQQVQSNSNMLSAISKTVADADDFVQGLKHHWLLRSAFKKKKTNAPPARVFEPVISPKQRQR